MRARAVACGALVLGATVGLPWLQATSLTLDPVSAIRRSLAILVPSLPLLYSIGSETECPAWKAFLRGLFSIPLGALVVAFFGITLGAPIGLEYAWRTFYWSIFMSVLMVAPAATIFGASWERWQRVFAFARPVTSLELCICIPAHGAAVGAWVGAWPMPLDWDRKWQEWPISCTYGAIAGYLLGTIVASVLVLLHKKDAKTD